MEASSRKSNVSLLRRDRFSPEAFHSVLAEGSSLETVYRLRYQAYIEEGYIEPNLTGLFFDEFDQEPNSRSFLTYFDTELVGSIRSCLYHPEHDLDIPAMEIFDRELRDNVGYDRPFVEANKFVVAPEFQRRAGANARISIYKNIYLHAQEQGADRMVIAVRAEHKRFYRMLGFKAISDVKSYPHLNFKTVLLACLNMEEVRGFLWEKTKAA